MPPQRCSSTSSGRHHTWSAWGRSTCRATSISDAWRRQSVSDPGATASTTDHHAQRKTGRSVSVTSASTDTDRSVGKFFRPFFPATRPPLHRFERGIGGGRGGPERFFGGTFGIFFFAPPGRLG